MIPKKWQLKVKLLRKLFDDVIGIKVIHTYGCGYRTIHSHSRQYSEPVLAIKSSRTVFMTAFYKAEFWIFIFSALWLSPAPYNGSCRYLLSCIVFLLGVCISSCTLSINERQRLSHVIIKIKLLAALYIDNYEFNLTGDLCPVLRLMVDFCPLLSFFFFCLSYFIADSSSTHSFSSLVTLCLAFRCAYSPFLIHFFEQTILSTLRFCSIQLQKCMVGIDWMKE